jgi:hypothetical protein
MVSAVAGLLQGNPDAANDFRKTRVGSHCVKSGIHPDEDHSKGSLLDAFLEPVKGFVRLPQIRVHRGDVVAAYKLCLCGGQELSE